MESSNIKCNICLNLVEEVTDLQNHKLILKKLKTVIPEVVMYLQVRKAPHFFT